VRLTAAVLTLAAAPLFAHVVSMSNGELRINGATAVYDLRMPTYEVSGIKDAEKILFDNIHFNDGQLLEHSCVTEQDMLHCTGKYLFNTDVDELKIRCTFAAVTVPNHVHIFRATKATGAADQSFFDIAYTEATLTFRPPTAGELFLKAGVEGAKRGLTGLTTILFLFALAVVAQDRKQFLTLCGILVVVELTMATVPSMNLSPKFLEAAAALSTAYLAIEKLLIPEAGQRWLVVAILGLFHGLFFRFFNPDLNPGFSAGLLLANLVWIGPAALLRFLPAKPLAIVLAVIGTFWFVYRIVY
jgi:hypothetical protein